MLDITNTGNAYRRLNNDEKSNIRRVDLGLNPGRDLTLISESGLYKLIMRSDKPEAKSFQNWVTRDVLPAIRKDDMYVQGEEKVKTGEAAFLSFLSYGRTNCEIGILSLNSDA